MKKVVVNDKMQNGYFYFLSEIPGSNFHKEFSPELTPKEMLNMGVFGGKYINDCQSEYPKNWFINARTSNFQKDVNLNFYKVNASLPLSVWKEKGWIYKDDPRGWFQWYCRYFMGRRIPEEDLRQIKRWKAMKRHIGAIKKNCQLGDLNCRKKQRQALLHWAYDSRKI
ncbi:MAG: hypothetical protein CMP49_00050 [Flavobacteriales bacterium]|nr:hypothetical protein [Flavobacteriales bacterium]|tara:strand:+ start:36475 stop:36978 length:504 start_codon:yes stop_codon:yes gene_type:complete